jgi:hypothetical protein
MKDYVMLSSPAWYEDSKSYLALMNVKDEPTLVAVVKMTLQERAKGMCMMSFVQVTELTLEGMTALMKFVFALTKHNRYVSLIEADARTLAIAIQAGLKSTNRELQEALAPLDFSFAAYTPSPTGHIPITMNKEKLKTFQPATLAHATDIRLTMSAL